MEIASYVPDRHEHYGYVIESTHLVALSRVSRRVRGASLYAMYQYVTLTSEEQLHALRRAPKDLLEHTRCVWDDL